MTTATTQLVDYFGLVVAKLEECAENREDCDACNRKQLCKRWFDERGTAAVSRRQSQNSNHYAMKEPRAVELIEEFNTKIKDRPVHTCPQCGNEHTWKHNNRYDCPKCGKNFKL